MANAFKRHVQRDIGTTITPIGAYTVGAATQVTLIGLTVANTTTQTIDIDITLYDGVNDTYIVKDAPVPVGGALVAIGGDQKVVLQTGDSIRVVSNIAASADAILSLLEIT